MLCSKCSTDKPEMEFSFIKSRGKYFAWCKECKRNDLRIWRELNPRPVEATPVVYRISNKLNGKVYIGVTHRPFGLRKNEHIRHSKTESRFPVHAAIRKYGVDNFNFEVVETLGNIASMEEAEVRYIAKFNSMVPNGYNRTSGGGGVCGLTHSDETRHAHSILHTGYRHSPEAIDKIRKAGTGRVIPREAVERSRAKRIGRKCTPEQKARISAGRAAGKKPRANRGNSKYPASVIAGAIDRVRNGEKQGAVALATGVSPSYLSKLVSGKLPLPARRIS